MTENIPLLSPIISEQHIALSIASQYLSLGNQMGAHVISPKEFEGSATLCTKTEIEESCLGLALKISTMILSAGILPLIALLVTIISRWSEDFRWKVEEIPLDQARAPARDLVQEHFDRLVQERAQAQKNLEDFKLELANREAEKIQEQADRAERLRKADEIFRKEQALKDLQLEVAVKAFGNLVNGNEL